MIEVTDEMIYAYVGEPEITGADAHYIRHGLAAVLAIVERDQAPTQDAYDAAVRALEKHRERADRAEAALTELRDKLAAGGEVR